MENKEKEIKKIISLYKIDTQLDELNTNKKDNETNNSPWKILKNSIKNLGNDSSPKGNYEINEIKLKKDFLSKYDRVCYKIKKDFYNSWQSYVKEFVDEELPKNIIKKESVLLLIKQKENDNIFAIGFGELAYNCIQKYIDQDFGLDIFSRVVEIDSNIVKRSKEQNVVGSTRGETSLYRQLHSIDDIDDFGKIFQELNAEIPKNILEGFGIETEKNFINTCAKSSFQIRKSINVATIEKYIEGCIKALKLPSKSLNSVKKLSNKKDDELIKVIKKNTVEELWKKIQQNEKFDLCHKEFDKYIEADNYNIEFKGKSNEISFGTTLNDLVDKYKLTELNFANFLDNAKIESFSNDYSQTNANVYKHLFLEYTNSDDSKKYFILNGNIYELKNEFIHSLNEKIKSFYKKNIFINTLEPWDINNGESEYNNSYNKKTDYIVVHPKTFKNIELCDLIKWDRKEDIVYLYYIKDNFQGTIRDLAYQVYEGAKIIQLGVNSNCEDLKGFYQNLENKGNFSEKQFIDLFNKDIRYVFAFRDHKNRLLKEKPEEFGSNIAKFALVDLEQKMSKIDNNSFKIEQIHCTEH